MSTVTSQTVFAVMAVVCVGSASFAQTPAASVSPAAISIVSDNAPLPADYVIGAADVLSVVFWREPELSGEVTVRPDGRISLPVIGEVNASGLHPEALRQVIRIEAEKFVADPNVQVVVRAINSRKIFVTGRVTTPGAHSLTAPLTIMQALALAGGLTEYADAKDIRIIRTVNGQSKTFKFNYRDVARGKALEQNIQLQPGDTVVVP